MKIALWIFVGICSAFAGLYGLVTLAKWVAAETADPADAMRYQGKEFP